MKRETANRIARGQAQLEAELEEIKAEAQRQMALDTAAADVHLQRADLSRKLSLSAPLESGSIFTRQTEVTVSPVSVSAADKTDKTSGQVIAPVRDSVRDSVRELSDGQADKVSVPASVRPAVVSAPVRTLSTVRAAGKPSLTAAVRKALAISPELTNAQLTEIVSAALGEDVNPSSVARIRLRCSA